MGTKYIVISISTGRIVSRNNHLINARDYVKSVKPEGGGSLMYEIYKFLE